MLLLQHTDIMKTAHKIIIGDSRWMNSVNDKSVHLVVTSPPYWQLKDYGNTKQIGFNDSYEDYINSLNLIWKEAFRILDDGCRLCINIGDQFARSVYYGRYKIIPIRTEIIKFCETIGFDYMGAVIWQKVTTTNTTGGATVMGSYPYPRNGMLKLDYEFIVIFRKGAKPSNIEKQRKLQSKLSKEKWNQYFSGHWNFAGEKQNKHLAMFPEELPKRLIKMFTFVGETVLDPFLGSGTTSLAARNQDRNSIGFEINEDFVPIIKNKLGPIELFNLNNSNYEFERQGKIAMDFSAEIKQLPYIFKDPVRIDKKVDPKKLQFGSKIDNGHLKKEKYFSVKMVIGPDRIVLNNGWKIRLIGIKPDDNKTGEAIDYLNNNTKGQRVFLKYDSQKYDNKNNRLCYLFLKNKTFINAHLIKKGLVFVDNGYEYKHCKRFLKYQKSH